MLLILTVWPTFSTSNFSIWFHLTSALSLSTNTATERSNAKSHAEPEKISFSTSFLTVDYPLHPFLFPSSQPRQSPKVLRNHPFPITVGKNPVSSPAIPLHPFFLDPFGMKIRAFLPSKDSKDTNAKRPPELNSTWKKMTAESNLLRQNPSAVFKTTIEFKQSRTHAVVPNSNSNLLTLAPLSSLMEIRFPLLDLRRKKNFLIFCNLKFEY